MALIPVFMRRPTAILKIPDAISRGLTPTAFLRELKQQGLSYRKQTFLSDWRSVSGIEARKDTMKYVRKDRTPSPKLIPDVEWEMSREYMYKVNTQSRLRPDEPLTERFVNIMSDEPLTPREVEQAVLESWAGWEKYAKERLVGMEVVGAYHRIEPLGEID